MAKYLEAKIAISLPFPDGYKEGDEIPSTYVTTGKVVDEVTNDGWQLVELTVEDDGDTEQRPCGCPMDYHMADCPHLTDRGSYPPEPEEDY